MADREGGGVPYTPNLVPQVNLDAPTQLLPQHIQDLERFLEEELSVIKTALLTATVQAAYGGLILENGPAPDQPLGAIPLALAGFDAFVPQVPNRMTAETTGLADSLVPEEGGIYHINAVLTVTVDSGSFYSITAAINGTITNIFSSIDASQQTTVVTFVLFGMLALNPGDTVTLVGIAQAQGSPHTFIMESGIFALTRVSEQNDEPGVF